MSSCTFRVSGQQMAYVATPPVEGGPKPASGPPMNLTLPITTSVRVDGREGLLHDGLSLPYHVSQQEVLSSAGTWGDFTRYLQLLPGVVWNNDYSNEIIVRGGNPAENLYVVDGIEIPNINHFALEGTTGGFASMLDTSLIKNVEMKPGVYDPSLSRRLSSAVEIETREQGDKTTSKQLDVGIAGVGGFVQRRLGARITMLLSAHRSVLNLATNDIGVNGVPIYTNGFAQADINLGPRDRVSMLNLSGADSINMTPQPCDAGVTSPIRTEYGGVRSTTGLVWQHFGSARSSSTLNASYSSQGQDIGQQWQSVAANQGCSDSSIRLTTVYSEHTHDGIGSLGYRFAIEKASWVYSAGVTARLNQFNYGVSQPLGGQSPFSPDPSWTDSHNFDRAFSAGESAGFLEATGHLRARWTLIGALREEAFALTGSNFLNAQGSVAFRATEHQALNFSFSRAAQLAPTINLLSYSQNSHLSPLVANQYSVAAQLWHGDRMALSTEAYVKRYSNEPVSIEYPSLMLANMVDTLGQQFVWLPLRSAGRGQAEGIELMLRTHTASRFRLLGTASYSRTRYAALDGILRPGNYDFPLVANAIANVQLHWGWELSLRNSYATGRPYTPFNIPLSEAQSRGIYDLSRLNGVRAPDYNRLDADVNRDFHLGKGVMNIHAGVENALDRQNFLGLVWMNSCHPQPTDTHCALIPMAVPGIPATQVSQMSIFPSAWVHYRF